MTLVHTGYMNNVEEDKVQKRRQKGSMKEEPKNYEARKRRRHRSDMKSRCRSCVI